VPVEEEEVKNIPLASNLPSELIQTALFFIIASSNVS
jgi:hypothetical protein